MREFPLPLPMAVARTLSVLLAVAYVACSGETVKPPSSGVDASADSMLDVSDESTPRESDVFSVDAGADKGDVTTCTPGEEPRPCSAALTGCPGVTTCSEQFGLRCPCRSCVLTLEPGTCSFIVTTDNLGSNRVDRIGTDGSSRQLTMIAAQPCGEEEHGFFVTPAPGTVTVTLCPASCREHELDPGVTFTLNRGPCPVM